MLKYLKKGIVNILTRIPLAKSMIKNRRVKRVRSYLSDINTLPLVFVYQMGKVASTSVYNSIKSQYKGPVFHAHSFDEKNQQESIQLLYNAYKIEKFRIKIISLVREPIGRNLSAFFENFKRDVGIEFRDSRYTPNELQEIFLKNYNHDIPLNWFDHNIKKNFDIDIYDYPFPESNYILIKNRNVELLLMKYNLNNEVKTKVISDFLGVKDFSIKDKNVGSTKEYADMYKKLQNIPFPEWYIDKMANSKYAQHFFVKEIHQIRTLWGEKNK